MSTDPSVLLAAEHIRSVIKIAGVDAGVVLGSGWSAALSDLAPTLATIPYSKLPGLVPTSVQGHAGQLSLHDLGGFTLACFSGRTHLYENHGVDAVVAMVRLVSALSGRTIILTNGCGSVRPDWAPGTPVIISDHINLTGTTPLSGPTFIDLSEAYSLRLRALVAEVDPTLPTGVYAQFRGPQYETPSEVRMAGRLGADLVGMSTALETIEARRLGLEVLGLSLVTNLAAGVSPHPLDHHEVIEAGRAAAPRLQLLLSNVLHRLAS